PFLAGCRGVGVLSLTETGLGLNILYAGYEEETRRSAARGSAQSRRETHDGTSIHMAGRDVWVDPLCGPASRLGPRPDSGLVRQLPNGSRLQAARCLLRTHDQAL